MSEPGVTRPGEAAAVTAAARPLGGRTKAGHMERAAENFVRPIVARAYESIAAAVRAEERERTIELIEVHAGEEKGDVREGVSGMQSVDAARGYTMAIDEVLDLLAAREEPTDAR